MAKKFPAKVVPSLLLQRMTLKGMLKLLAILIGIGLNIGMFILVYAVFLIAYLAPKKGVTIIINHYGEAHIELVLLTIALILNLVGLCLFVRAWNRLAEHI